MSRFAYYVLASYNVARRLAPSLCERAQRDLDAIDPKIVLQVDGTRVEIRGPNPGEYRVQPVMYALIEASKAVNQFTAYDAAMPARSQHCRVTNQHRTCPRETALGTKPCGCPCHGRAS